MTKTLALINRRETIPLGIIRWAIVRSNPWLDTDELDIIPMQQFRMMAGVKAPSGHITYGLMRVVMDDLEGLYF